MSSSSITSISPGEGGALALWPPGEGGILSLRPATSTAHTGSFE